MPDHTAQPAPQLKRLLPAWMFSVLIHCAILAIVCTKIQPWSKGSADAQHGSIAIVLNHTVVDGTSNSATPYDVVQTAAVFGALAPPELLAIANTTVNEPAPGTSEQSTNTQSQAAATTSGTKKAATTKSKSGGTS